MAKSTSRSPRYCRKCPGAPLRSQCVHTQAGRNYLSRQNTDTGSADIVGEAQGHPTNIVHPQPTQSMIDPTLFNPTREPFFAPTPTSTPVPQVPVLPITPRQAHETQLSTPVGPTEAGGAQAGTPEREAERLAAPSKTRYATVKNPIHGLVEGAKRGNTKFDIARQRPLPGSIREAQNSTRRFNRVMRDLVARCERLSAETGCWLYFSGQHVNANLGFCSYISPRLRREAKAQVTEIQNASNIMYTTLLNARRLDAVSLSLQAEKSKEELEKVRLELAERDLHITQLQSELRAQLGSV